MWPPRPHRHRSITPSSPHRPPATYILLLLLGLIALFWKILPSLQSATDSLTTSLLSHLHLPLPTPQTHDFCTQEIGNSMCCALYLGSEPCVDECRKQFVDRGSWTLTKDYGKCEDDCLAVYHSTCGGKHAMVMDRSPRRWTRKRDGSGRRASAND